MFGWRGEGEGGGEGRERGKGGRSEGERRGKSSFSGASKSSQKIKARLLLTGLAKVRKYLYIHSINIPYLFSNV